MTLKITMLAVIMFFAGIIWYDGDVIRGQQRTIQLLEINPCLPITDKTGGPNV